MECLAQIPRMIHFLGISGVQEGNKFGFSAGKGEMATVEFCSGPGMRFLGRIPSLGNPPGFGEGFRNSMEVCKIHFQRVLAAQAGPKVCRHGVGEMGR